MNLKFVAAIIFTAMPALGQTSGPVNVFGIVSGFDQATLSILNDSTKAAEAYRASPDLTILQNRKVTLADIKPNDFIASAASRGVDGKLHSIEVRIYPEALRGNGEGQRPMDEANSRTMTNATVTGAALVGDSNKLTVTFPGGQSELIVDPGVPVIRIETVDRDAVRPGMRVRVQGTQGPDGGTIRRITIQE